MSKEAQKVPVGVRSAVLVALSPWLAFATWTIAAGSLAQLVMAVVGLRLGLALLQWVSRVYVLTNRRVMRIRGVPGA